MNRQGFSKSLKVYFFLHKIDYPSDKESMHGKLWWYVWRVPADGWHCLDGWIYETAQKIVPLVQTAWFWYDVCIFGLSDFSLSSHKRFLAHTQLRTSLVFSITFVDPSCSWELRAGFVLYVLQQYTTTKIVLFYIMYFSLYCYWSSPVLDWFS